MNILPETPKKKLLKPWSIQIELTHGCNRFCDFCAIRTSWKTKEDRKLNFLNLEMADRISKELNSWLPNGKRIEFGMHGEPSLNPKTLDIVKVFRTNFSKAQLLIYTNSDILFKNGIFNESFVESLFSNGLNFLLIENYDGEKQMEKFINAFSSYGTINYYDTNFNMYSYHGTTDKKVIMLGSIAKHDHEKRQRRLNNFGGNVDYNLTEKYGIKILEHPLEKRCVLPFREMIIEWDGIIPACCVDWKRNLIMGKYPEDGTLETIWNSDSFKNLRQLLYRRNRFVSPCCKCDFDGGFRQGLIDDPEDFPFDENTNLSRLEDLYKKYAEYHDKYSKFKIFHENISSNNFF